MSFPPATEMFQFAGFASPTYGFSQGSVRRLGLPHSEIRESTSARLSSRLFAACHVLHRLSVPRHPPDALMTLDPSPGNFSPHAGTNLAVISNQNVSNQKELIADRCLPNLVARTRRENDKLPLKTLLPSEDMRLRWPVARPNKTHGPRRNPRFTHIHNVKHPGIRSQ